MKRPLAVIGFTGLIALIAIQYLPPTAVAVGFFLALFTALKTIFPLRRRNGAGIAVSVTVCVCVALYFGATELSYRPVMALADQEATVTATILEPPSHSNGRAYYIIRVTDTGLENAPRDFKLRLSAMQPLEAEIYDEVTCRVRFMRPTENRGYDSLTYYKAQNIYLYAYTLDFSISVKSPEQKPLMFHIKSLRQTIRNKILETFPNDEGGLMVGMLLGDRSNIERSVGDQFRTAGVSHILALSGMHFTILTALLMQLFLALRLTKRKCALILMGFVVFYMALAGFTPSIVRSGIMILLLYSANLFRRRSDSLTSLGFAVLVMALASPFGVLDAGFLLSVAGTLGIVVMSPPMEERLREKLPRFLANCIAVSLSATLFTLPLVILLFGEVSTISLLANLLLSLPTTVMLIFSFLFAFLSFVPFLGFLANPVGLVTGLCAKLTMVMVRLLSEIPFAMLSASQDYIQIWLGFSFLLFGLAWLLRRKKPPLRLAALLSLLVLLSGVFSFQLSNHNAIEVAALDVGDGAAVVLTRQDRAIVVSGGGDRMAGRDTLNYLKEKGIRTVDLVVVPDLSADTAAGAVEVLKKYPIQTMISRAEGSQKSRVAHYLSDSAVRHEFSDARARLWSEVDIQSREGKNGSIVWIAVKEIRFLLLTGSVAAGEIPEGWRNPDVLISSEPADHAEHLRYQFLFYSVGEALNLKISPSDGENIWTTGGNGSLVMTCFDRREISLRREEE